MLKYLLIIAATFIAAPVFGAASWYFGEHSVIIEAGEMPLSGKVNGYEDIILKVSNQSDKTRTIDIKLSGERTNSQLQSISKTVELTPGKIENVRFIKPYLSMSDIEVKVWIDHSKQKPFNLHVYKGDSASRWSSPTSILISDKLSYDFFYTLINSTTKKGLYNENKLTVYRNEKLPESGYAFSGFDCVLLAREQIEQSSQKAKDTLYNYVRAGGSLFVYGRFQPQIAIISSKTDGILSYYEYGLGMIVTAETEDYNQIESLDWNEISAGLWKNRPFVYNYMHSNTTINDWCKIVNVSPVPSKIMVAVIILMIIIIGPVNILVLRIINKPILMYITVPLISLIAAVMILVFSISKEGTENTERIAGFTVLDQRTGQASTAVVLGYYCPFLPIDELNFSTDTQVIPLNITGISTYSDKHINLNNGQRFYGGWINSRVPSHFAAIKLSQNFPSVAEFKTGDNGQTELFNTSASTISAIRYKRIDGTVWQAENIEGGKKVVMSPYQGSQSSMDRFPVRNMIKSDWLKSGSRIYDTPFKDLYPGCYIADLTDELFFETPTGSKKANRRYDRFVYGITGEVK